MAQNIFAAGMDAFDGSIKRQDDFRQGLAGMTAGKRLAAGDRRGAMTALGNAGNVDGVRVLQRDQSTADQEAEQQRQAKAKQKAEVLLTVTGHLQTVPQGGRMAALQGAMPLFQAAEIDASPFAGLTEEQLSDQNLVAFTGSVKKAVEQFTLTPGAKRFDANGTLIAEAPTAPSYHTVGEGQTLVETGAAPSGLAAPQEAGGDWLSGVSEAAPDAQVTNGYRSPEHNARVGGVPNSKHLSGRAVDLVPRPGETMAQLYARVSRAPGVRAINEGDHVHVQAQGGALAAGGGARVVAQGAPKQREQWVDLPGGGQRNTLTGKVDGISSRDASKTFDQEQKLRQQFGQQPAVKDLANVRAHIATIGAIGKKAIENPGGVTAQDDLALIFAFMKMLDPGSVVREGEFANAQNTAGVPERLVNAYNNALKGTRLTNRQRQEFFKTASTVMDSYSTGAADQADRYRNLAGNYGLSPDNVSPAIRRPKPRPAPNRTADPKRPPIDQFFK